MSKHGKILSYGEFWKNITDANGVLDYITVKLPNGRKLELDITGKIELNDKELC